MSPHIHASTEPSAQRLLLSLFVGLFKDKLFYSGDYKEFVKNGEIVDIAELIIEFLSVNGLLAV